MNSLNSARAKSATQGPCPPCTRWIVARSPARLENPGEDFTHGRRITRMIPICDNRRNPWPQNPHRTRINRALSTIIDFQKTGAFPFPLSLVHSFRPQKSPNFHPVFSNFLRAQSPAPHFNRAGRQSAIQNQNPGLVRFPQSLYPVAHAIGLQCQSIPGRVLRRGTAFSARSDHPGQSLEPRLLPRHSAMYRTRN